MSNCVPDIIKEIKYKFGDTLEEISNKIGYSRQQLTKIRDASVRNIEFEKLLLKTYKIDLQNVNFGENVVDIVAEDSVSYTKKVAYNLKDEIKQIKSSLSEILEFQRAIMINIDTGLEPLLSDLGKRIGVDNLPSKVRSSAALKLAKVLEMGI